MSGFLCLGADVWVRADRVESVSPYEVTTVGGRVIPLADDDVVEEIVDQLALLLDQWNTNEIALLPAGEPQGDDLR